MAEYSERLRHLLPSGTGRTERYINPQRPRPRSSFPSRNRASHGNYLRQRLTTMRNRAVELGHERIVFGLDADESICLEFIGEAGYDLAVRSLEHAGQGIELLVTHQRDNRESATVYVPSGKIDYFIRRVEQYLEEDTSTGKPKHQRLVEGISDIRMALLEAFWSDAPSLMPRSGVEVWWEVWLRGGSDFEHTASDTHDDILTSFRDYAARGGLGLGDERTILRFPERFVLLVHGTLEQMARSVEILNCIAELRLARVRIEDFLALSPLEQAAWIHDLRQRTSPPTLDAPAVCLLDTGVMRIHPLLEIGLNADDCHTYHPGWGTADHDGHGTQMAGVALYGDLAETIASSNAVILSHRLESVKILPPPGYSPNDPKLYGYVTQQAVARAEIQAYARKRVICMTVAGAPPDHLHVPDVSSAAQGGDVIEQINAFYGRGRPSSWSAAIDQLSSGALDEQRRLILLPAGNSQLWSRRYYPNSNLTHPRRCMIKVGMLVECGRDGLEVHVCRRLCQLLGEHFGMQLQLDIVPMDNKQRLLEECGTAACLLFANGCERVVILWDERPPWPKMQEPLCWHHERAKILRELQQAGIAHKPVFLVCVEREFESWLLFDERLLSKILSTDAHPVRIPTQRYPDRMPNPKGTMTTLFRKYGRKTYADTLDTIGNSVYSVYAEL